MASIQEAAGTVRQQTAPGRAAGVAARGEGATTAPAAGGPPPRRTRAASWLPLVAAVVLWAVSVPRIDLQGVTDVGLISVLPVTSFVALGLLTFGFLVELLRRRPRALVLGLHVTALVVMLHGLIPLIYDVPSYPWVYRHIGLTRYFETHVTTKRSIDIYQNWTGFFTGAAYFSRVTGLDPVAYANWAQLLFAGCNVLAVRFAARTFTTNTAVVSLAMWIYVMGDWIGQNYFAPQSLAFLLSLTATALVLRCFDSRRKRQGVLAWCRRRASLIADWTRHLLRTTVDESDASPRAHLTIHERTAALLAAALVITVIISHPLSPFFLTGWLMIVVVMGRRRIWWLPVLALVGTLVWTLLARSWMQGHVNIFHDVGNASKNASGAAAPVKGKAGHELVGTVARTLALGMWALAAVGFWRRIARHRDPLAALLLVAPFPFVLGQSYGGEAIYRIYLFSLPWASLLAAWAFLGSAGRATRKSGAALVLVLAVMAPMFLVARFGLERTNRVVPAEIEAANWFSTHSPRGSVLVSVGPGSPAAATPDYLDHYTSWGQWGATILGSATAPGIEPTRADLPSIESYLNMFSPHGFFVVAGPTQEAYVEDYGIAPAGSVNRFVDVLRSAPEYRQVFEKDGVTMFEYLGRSPGSP